MLNLGKGLSRSVPFHVMFAMVRMQSESAFPHFHPFSHSAVAGAVSFGVTPLLALESTKMRVQGSMGFRPSTAYVVGSHAFAGMLVIGGMEYLLRRTTGVGL